MFFQRPNDCGIIDDLHWLIERGEASLMREQFSERDFVFAVLRELRPKLRHTTR
ncbi:MAG TPA: hypothetical protein VHW03_05105 [Chthoniobacterales bacterium]|nr:hypothetical protein [Chthoniobacterales bacterium]